MGGRIVLVYLGNECFRLCVQIKTKAAGGKQMEKEYLNEKEVSRIIGRSISSLRQDRMRAVGLPYIKWPGQRRVYYSRKEIEHFMVEHTVSAGRDHR